MQNGVELGQAVHSANRVSFYHADRAGREKRLITAALPYRQTHCTLQYNRMVGEKQSTATSDIHILLTSSSMLVSSTKAKA